LDPSLVKKGKQKMLIEIIGEKQICSHVVSFQKTNEKHTHTHTQHTQKKKNHS